MSIVFLAKKNMIKLMSYIRICFLNCSRHILIDKSAWIFDKTKISCSSEKLQIESGSIIEKNVRLLAADGGILHIGKNVYINEYCRIICRDRIEICDDTLLGPNVSVFDHDHDYSFDGVSRECFKTSPIIIEENCWIGAGCIILRGAHIGHHSIIGAGTFIKGEVPPHSIVRSSRNVIVEEIRRK